jgi:hypothetical protein
MNTSTRHDQAVALANLQGCELDLTAAHKRVLDAASGLTGARRSRADELTELLADALAFTRRLAMVVEGDLRAEETQR